MFKKLERDTIETFLTRIPVMIFTFLYSIFLIRLLGPEGNGLYACAAWASVCTYGITSLLVGSIIVQEQKLAISKMFLPRKSDFLWIRENLKTFFSKQ